MILGLRFIRGPGLASTLIEWFGGGGFSHVDIVLPTGLLLGARSDKAGGQPPGVRVRPSTYTGSTPFLRMERECTAEQWATAWDFLEPQIGKSYDRTAIVGFAAGRDWREDDSWFCSELATRMLEVAGIVAPLPLHVDKVTPGTCACVFGAVGAVSAAQT